MALHLLLKRKPNSNILKNPSILHFSTSAPKDEPQTPATADSDNSSSSKPATTARPQSSFSSYLSELRGNLKNQQQQSQPNSQAFQFRRSTAPSFTSTNAPHNKSTPNLEEIRKKLSKFRHPSALPPANSDATSSSTSVSPSLPHQPQQITLEELYKRNVSGTSDASIENAEMTPEKVGGTPSYDLIRESLRKTAFGARNVRRNMTVDRMSLSSVQNSFMLKPSDVGLDSKVVGGKDSLPVSIFGREMMEKKEGNKSLGMNTELRGMYSFGRLGERLKELRPEMKGGNWFSIQELNERLSKLRELEEKEAESANSNIQGLRKVLFEMKDFEMDSKKSTFQRFDLHGLSQMGRTPDFMLKPPKEHLVEKYFHPDNMSSAEKLKIELAKVKEEFKMSESDCGSSRVQVALLTTKIKHLSSVLHKKDKHSRKGLEEMVQKRKKLLKYLRRTDWDSYCFVISKLGLRDNPISRA